MSHKDDMPITNLRGYFDESGTHAGSPLSLIAGHVGDARAWRKFEKLVSALFVEYDVDIFHSTDLKRGDRSFRGWSVDKKIDFLDEMNNIANRTLAFGIVSILKEDDWQYYCGLDWPKKARRDTRYTIMFRAAMSMVLDQSTKVFRSHVNPRMTITLEQGHKNAPDVARLFEFVRTRFPNSSAMYRLNFESKSSSVALAAADLLAYGAYVVETGGKPLGVAKKPLKGDSSYQQNIWRIVLNRQALLELHEQALAIAAGTLPKPENNPG